ncbi:MAG: biopolymer transporter ExbD [Salinisphaera sp.]|nr:biopolymer transporter ExbD [Salinisphaera sp.]
MTHAPPRLRFAAEPKPRRALISLTPLIDVVFILLLFFMLASSFSDYHSISLDPPAAKAGPTSMQGALLVEVRRDGLRFAGTYVSLQGLVQRVRHHLQRTPGRRVLVQPGPGVSLQKTVNVLDRLIAAGATHLSLLGKSG